MNQTEVKGTDLTPDERLWILESYIHRDTTDSPWSDYARLLMGKAAPVVNDQEWIDARLWQRTHDGIVLVSHD